MFFGVYKFYTLLAALQPQRLSKIHIAEFATGYRATIWERIPPELEGLGPDTARTMKSTDFIVRAISGPN